MVWEFNDYLFQVVTKPVFKGMLTMMKALVQGLELTYQNQGMGGMSSAFMILEIIHTHFWEKDIGSSRSDTSNPSLVRLCLKHYNNHNNILRRRTNYIPVNL